VAQIIYETGDLLDADERYIVHGCNAQGVMGSGVAKLIRARYPKAYVDYRQVYETAGLRLGQIIWSDCERHVVLNAITQDKYGTDPNVIYCDYEAIRAAMRTIERSVDGARVAMPLIGAGRAHGSGKIISAIIEDEATTFQPVVYLVNGQVPTT
jgi:O-acetyl-ADP-ribose deacetylase (regulator of RNase III)